jgi:hypothetical protein
MNHVRMYVTRMNEGQTSQWPKEKDVKTSKDLQTLHKKNKDRVTRTPLKTGCEMPMQKSSLKLFGQIN